MTDIFWSTALDASFNLVRPPTGHTWVYGLFDSDQRLRYVGKTTGYVNRRRDAHWARRHEAPSHLGSWLRSLTERPQVRVLGLFTEEEWAHAERAWIRDARVAGCDLVNTSEGGESGSAGVTWVMTPARAAAIEASRGRKRSPSAVEATAAAHRGMKRPPETVAKISAAKRGKPWTDAMRDGQRRSREELLSCECGAGPFRGGSALANHKRSHRSGS